MEDDAYSFGEPVPALGKNHLAGCRAVPVIKKGETEPTTHIAQCEDDCPHVQAAIKRGLELAAEHGWP